MRSILAIVLLIASTGMIYASFTAPAPVPGIDYDITTVTQEQCNPEATLGDRLLSLVSDSANPSESVLIESDRSIGGLLHHLACGFVNH